MEIIKRSRQEHIFVVLRDFYYGGRLRRKGDEIDEISDWREQAALCRIGKISPILPKVGVYIALTSLVLPGKTEKFSCKKLEIVELRDTDALPLLLGGQIIPKNDDVWRPNNRKLARGKK
jgi:hypothetical protein